MNVRLHPHALVRLAERGTTEEEVPATVQAGDKGNLVVVNEALAQRQDIPLGEKTGK